MAAATRHALSFLALTLAFSAQAAESRRDRDTGKEAWRSLQASEPGYAPPTILEQSGTRRILTWDADTIAALDPLSGRPAWSVPLKPGYGMSIMAPQVATTSAGRVLFASGIGQVGALGFWKFVAACIVPAAIALAIVFVTVRWMWRGTLFARAEAVPPEAAPLDRAQLAIPAAAVVLLLVLFATPLPRELSAVAVAAVLLASRRFASRDMLVAVDWPLILLFTGLFIVNDALAATGATRDVFAWLAAHGLVPDRVSLLAPLALVFSNTIGNVPAVIMLLAIWPNAPEGALYGLALQIGRAHV